MDIFGKTLTHRRNAGRLAGRARDHGRDMIREGVRLRDVAEAVEAFIRREGGSVAFPVNLAINEVAAHYTPSHDDEAVFCRGDVVKLDVGAHEKGHIGDTAVTVEVTTHYHGAMIRASSEALFAAIEMMRPGVDLKMVGSRVEDVIRSYGFSPVRNLTGHSMEPYNLHAGLSIPSVGESVKGEVKEGDLIAIEPFATDGAGKVDGTKKSNIYRFNRDNSALKGPAKEMVRRITGEFRTLPFSERWAARSLKRPAPVLQQLVRTRTITSYPILVDVKGGTVTQTEHTVLITSDGCEVLTRV